MATISVSEILYALISTAAFALGTLLPSSILFYFGLILNSSGRKRWVFLSSLIERVYCLTHNFRSTLGRGERIDQSGNTHSPSVFVGSEILNYLIV